MDAAILVFAWFWMGQPPAGSQIPFPSMALCQEARQNLFADRKRALNDAGDTHRVPQLTATCVATGGPKPTASSLNGVEWLISQPVNLLDWGLQRAANAIEAVRAVSVKSELNGVPIEDTVDVEFSLAESNRFKYTIQGMIAARSPERLNESYCLAALKVWRQAVLKTNGDNSAASIDVWFSHIDRGPAERPKGLAEAVTGNFEFKMTVSGSGEQPLVSCSTPFAVEPVVPSAAAKAP